MMFHGLQTQYAAVMPPGFRAVNNRHIVNHYRHHIVEK